MGIYPAVHKLSSWQSALYQPSLRYTLRREPSAYPSRHLIVHSLRLEWLLLSARHEAFGLSEVLCRTIWHRRGWLDFLRMSDRSHSWKLECSNAWRFTPPISY